MSKKKEQNKQYSCFPETYILVWEAKLITQLQLSINAMKKKQE